MIYLRAGDCGGTVCGMPRRIAINNCCSFVLADFCSLAATTMLYSTRILITFSQLESPFSSVPLNRAICKLVDINSQKYSQVLGAIKRLSGAAIHQRPVLMLRLAMPNPLLITELFARATAGNLVSAYRLFPSGGHVLVTSIGVCELIPNKASG